MFKVEARFQKGRCHILGWLNVCVLVVVLGFKRVEGGPILVKVECLCLRLWLSVPRG